MKIKKLIYKKVKEVSNILMEIFVYCSNHLFSDNDNINIDKNEENKNKNKQISEEVNNKQL